MEKGVGGIEGFQGIIGFVRDADPGSISLEMRELEEILFRDMDYRT